ncbi:MAG TPA: sialidase family protein, partial [Bryobacteraceae bacterium]|nr:sialidase family protein [Bryobacteraceae bacterium]
MLPLVCLLLAVHIAPNGASPEYRQPQLAAGDGMVAVTFGADNAIYFSASRDQGKTFSTPVKVAEAPKLMLGRHRGPRIAITPAAIVISAVVAEAPPAAQPGPHKHVTPTSGDLKAWRSTDGGKTWSAGVAINDVAAAAREGLHSMASGGGVVFATWLDLRSKGTRLYGSVSTDGGATWSKNRLVYESPSGTICQCCHPTAVIDSKGQIHVMWRNALEGNRDMYAAVSRDGGQSFGAASKLGGQSWKLEACPMDGGGLAASGTRILAAWRRESTVYVSEPDKAERRIGDGKDPALAVAGGRAAVAWSEGAALRAWREGQAAPETLAG